MSLLEMKHIKKEFAGCRGFGHFAFLWEQGEILAIIRTVRFRGLTLLRCATMLETIDDGDILYLGKERHGWKMEDPLFRKAGDERD